MKRFVEMLLFLILRIVLWFRYRIKIKGVEKLNKKNLNKPGGVIFLPNHPCVFIDPATVAMAVSRRFPIRPMIVEYFYYTPGVYQIMQLMNALPVPDFDQASNSLKKRKSEEVVKQVMEDLRKGDNFLIYPAGRTKQTGYESVGGASAVHRIVNEVPEANIVLVRTKGLWGSSFSRAFTGKAPPLFPTIWTGMKHVFKNLIFFTPRRYVEIEFTPAPDDFPYNASRVELNKWLERWYNRPDGLTEQEGEYPGDSLMLVSYSIWKKEIPEIHEHAEEDVPDIEEMEISGETIEKVTGEISRITGIKKDKIKPEMSLSSDLGMDSLDISELIAFIQHAFDVKSITVAETRSVAKAYAIADKKIVCEGEPEKLPTVNFSKWGVKGPRERRRLAPGNTIPEVFLNNCARMGNSPACGDDRTGILTYKELKLRAILLAEYLRHLPGEHIGIMLPSCVPANLCVLACQIAGKVPLLINWTVGPRHLEAVDKLSDIQCVLTSWAFLDRLENIDLDGIEDKLIMLEDLKRKFGLKQKLRALYRSFLSTNAILKIFNIQDLSKESRAVLLFTSGTESLPKGVPLSHHNILFNQQQSLKTIEIYSDDIFYGILPPFHAFGFTVSGLLSLLVGIRVVYSPDPTDGQKMAETCRKWGVTLTCGAPTFLKNMLKAGKTEDFKTIRLFVTGAEKAPAELFRLSKERGIGDAVYEGYGITECSPVLTMNRFGKPQAGVGEPLPGVELKIVHPETFQPLPQGEQGHILAKGENIFSGYLNPDLASPFITVDGEEWYKTGDLGYLDEAGRLIISGRQKRFIKVGGEMISLSAIEDALNQKASDKNWELAEEGPSLAIIAKEKPGEKPEIKLVSVFKTDSDEVNSTLREAGFGNLVKVSDTIQIKEIPLMGSGKIFYRTLENEYFSDEESR